MELMNIFSNTVALFFLYVFGSAAVSKLTSSNRVFYQRVLEGYGIRMPELATVFIYLIALFELLAAMAIALIFSRFLGVVLCMSLTVVYFSLVAMQLLRGNTDKSCGCAGPHQDMKLSPGLLLRQLVYLCLLLVCLIGVDDQAALDSSFLQSINFSVTSAWILSVALAGALILINLSLETLQVNAQKLALLKPTNARNDEN